MYTYVICSPFVEHPVVDVARIDASEYDIVVFEDGQPSNFLNKGTFSKDLYCKCLLYKLFTTAKSKIKPFIQYQCEKMDEPIVWLNKFEKLIDLNRELFTTKDQVIKFEKALMIIEVLRDSIEQKKIEPSIRFNFNEVKSKIKKYDSYDEQLAFLYEEQAEYRQNKPKLIDPTSIPFDEKCAIEIEKIEKLEQLKKRVPLRDTVLKTKSTSEKMIIRGHINILVDAFYQMFHEKKANGLPYLGTTMPELISFLTLHFLDKDGNPLSESTIRTILSPNRPEKRPKNENILEL